MAQINLPHTLVAGTPENVNDVQDNFQQVVDHFNNALVGDDNLTSPNNSVSRVVFEGRIALFGGNTATTYLMAPNQTLLATTDEAYNVPLWTPVTASYAVAGKTTQIRTVATLLVNSTAPVMNFTVGLSRATAVTGVGGVMNFSLGPQGIQATFVNPGAESRLLAVSSWTSLALLAEPYALTVVVSGGGGAIVTNSTVSISAAVEMRHA